ncbi:tetratricopeptide repeat protein [Paenibacillus arenilitoris]|uniref:Tetratricopeptide repeat protein n=1 Tax=Paenibacillus arenilitoris TaxID=2772299 RepID=A0A927CPR8_9BACL|nr:hypothetical protein [Paenibacillus arenilitoris]MBD2869696.1 hypothetical protein [Paenibacillus arenilitoris]
MFQHMFASMNEMLDRIMDRYDDAGAQEKKQYEEQLTELKNVSDHFVEQWLEFEEKFAEFKERRSEPSSAQSASTAPAPAYSGYMNAEHELPVSGTASCNAADLMISDEAASIISKGQGYYKLFMFPQAATQFQSAIVLSPECNLARLFLGMTHMHLQNWNEAQRHFQLLIALTDFPKWLAMGYNALGCIQAIHLNLAQAELLFKKAHDVCPSFTEALSNLRSCQETPQQLSLYFGSTELCCL